MKRSSALTTLSRDHHHALVTALSLLRARGREQRARDDFLTFWHDDGALHFRLEEEVLLPGLAGFVEPDDPVIVEVLVQHVGIRRRADLLAGAVVPRAELEALGRALQSHVRYEESVLFPHVENHLPSAELEVLGERLREGT